MAFIKAPKKHFLLIGSLAVASIAFTVSACGGGGDAASLIQGSAPGHWTQAEVSQFTAGGGGAGGGSENACILRYFEQDMSFGNAMALESVASPSDSNLSLAQIKAAVISKYGPTEGNPVNAQFEQVGTDVGINCNS